MAEGCSHKRKRLEHIVESHVILAAPAPSQYRLAGCNDQRGYSKKVCVAVQQSSSPDQDVLGVRQQLAVHAHNGSVQPTQTTHASVFDTTTGLSEPSCKHGLLGNIAAEQVCFGMVRLLSLLSISTL